MKSLIREARLSNFNRVKNMDNKETMDKSETNVEVRCSCGKTTRVIFSEISQVYRPIDKSWVFKSEGENVGWNCGKKDHYQVYP